MSKFSPIIIDNAGVTTEYQPYDRGQNGAFVYREKGMQVHAPRLVASTKVDDNASDRMSVQLNKPVWSLDNNGLEVLQGTDLVKVEMRFLASTKTDDRIEHIDKAVLVLQQLRTNIENREVIFV